MFKEINILKIFFENPNKKFHVREAAKILKINPATASKYFKHLTKNEILKYKKERNLDLYKANIESEFYRDLKVYYNITKIRKSGLIGALNGFYLKPTIIFFGSAAHGYDTEKSDFDFVVVSEVAKDLKTKHGYEKKIGREIQIFVVKKLKELGNEHLINNVLSGILLQGDLKWM